MGINGDKTGGFGGRMGKTGEIFGAENDENPQKWGKMGISPPTRGRGRGQESGREGGEKARRAGGRRERCEARGRRAGGRCGRCEARGRRVERGVARTPPRMTHPLAEVHPLAARTKPPRGFPFLRKNGRAFARVRGDVGAPQQMGVRVWDSQTERARMFPADSHKWVRNSLGSSRTPAPTTSPGVVCGIHWGRRGRRFLQMRFPRMCRGASNKKSREHRLFYSSFSPNKSSADTLKNRQRAMRSSNDGSNSPRSI